MSARTVAGWTALGSGALLVAAVIATAVSGGWAAPAPWSGMGPGMMGGPGMMSGGQAGGVGMMHGWGRATGTTATRPGAAQVTVRALSFSFEPSEVRLPKGAEIDLTLTNPTAIVHDLTVPALGIALVAPPGTSRTLALSGLPAGRYVGYCGVPGHAEAGMRTTVVVE